MKIMKGKRVTYRQICSANTNRSIGVSEKGITTISKNDIKRNVATLEVN